MVSNEYGEIVKYTWKDLVNHVEGIELDAFVVMPNHIHGIIMMVGLDAMNRDCRGGFQTHPNRAGLEPAPTGTGMQALSEIVRQLKTFSARRINKKRDTMGVAVWQRNYWEHIIRNEKSYHTIVDYIIKNPENWELDQLK